MTSNGNGGHVKAGWAPMKGISAISQYHFSAKSPESECNAYIVLLASNPDWSPEPSWATARAQADKSAMDSSTYDAIWRREGPGTFDELKFDHGVLRVRFRMSSLGDHSSEAQPVLRVGHSHEQINSSISMSSDAEAVFTFTWTRLQR